MNADRSGMGVGRQEAAMRYRWPEDTAFRRVVLDVEDRDCPGCGGRMHICDHRHHKIFSLPGPVHLVNRLVRCPERGCPGHQRTFSPAEEVRAPPPKRLWRAAKAGWTLPWWLIGWDVFAWIGQRRFARHWSVPQVRAELSDSLRIVVSEDSIERYIGTYQRMLAARHQDPDRLAQDYRGQNDLILSIDGLQPEKGHETLYVVRELRLKRVWFAQPLLSSAAAEVHEVLAEARRWAEALGLAVALWLSDKQDAFVSGIAAEFPDVPHRYCENHFLRDLAKPLLEADSQAKVAMRRKIRGLRSIERDILQAGRDGEGPGQPGESEQVVLDYCTTVRGILNSDQGGPLEPAGLKMAEAVGQVRASIQRNLAGGKKGRPRTGCDAWPGASTAGCRRSGQTRRRCGRTSRPSAM